MRYHMLLKIVGSVLMTCVMMSALWVSTEIKANCNPRFQQRIVVKETAEAAATPALYYYYYGDGGGWNVSVCSSRNGDDFIQATLHTSAGDTPIFVYTAEEDQHVSGSLLSRGSWETDLVHVLLKLLSRDPHLQFIDIGTNIGVYALTVAKVMPERKVIAVDALDMNVQRLCASSAQLIPSSITLVRAALSNVTGEEVTLGIDRGNIGGSFVTKDQNPNKVNGSDLVKDGNKNYGTVRTAQLDDLYSLVSEVLFDNNDFTSSNKKVVMKMDVCHLKKNYLSSKWHQIRLLLLLRRRLLLLRLRRRRRRRLLLLCCHCWCCFRHLQLAKLF